MSNINKKVPKIRFLNFSSRWDKKELGEISKFNPTADLPDVFEYIDLESVQGTTILNHRTEKKVSAPSRAQRLARWGDIFYQTVRPYQKNNCLYDLPYDNYVFSTGYAQIRPDLNNYFLFSYIQNEKFVSKVLKRSIGTSYPSINSKDLSKIIVGFPNNIEEQNKLGEFFKQLDDTITLQQQLLNDHKQLKKAMLQKMFPQKGETVPRVRFGGFADAWKQSKLKDVLSVSKERNKKNIYTRNDVLSVSREVGTVNQIEYQGRSFAGKDISNYKILEINDLIYTKSPLKGAPHGVFQMATIKGIVSPLYAVYKSTKFAYTPFVAMQLKDDNIATHYLSPLVSKGAKNTINITDEGALEGKLWFPNMDEQHKIFDFFKKLDETIKLHQKKLETYQELKKAMLRKMFV